MNDLRIVKDVNMAHLDGLRERRWVEVRDGEDGLVPRDPRPRNEWIANWSSLERLSEWINISPVESPSSSASNSQRDGSANRRLVVTEQRWSHGIEMVGAKLCACWSRLKTSSPVQEEHTAS
jgi:hypothetical protein